MNRTPSQTRRWLLFAAGVLGLLLSTGVASNAEQFAADERRAAPVRAVLPIERDLAEGLDDDSAQNVPEPIELPQWFVVALSITLGVGFLYLLSRQRFSFRFRRPSIHLSRGPKLEVSEEEQAEEIAEFARDLIDELNEGDSPRYAIQRAYAAVETGFGAPELTRKAAETPLRYLNRIFGNHAAMQDPLADLTRLFQHARFSDEPVEESKRAEAIAALTQIRDYYQAFAWKKINRRLERERAGSKR